VRGDHESAARLLGAANAIVEEIAWQIAPHERDAFDDATRPVLERIDEPAIAAALEAGRRMSEANAAEYALTTAN
jgi:hypothetical protein